MITKSCRCIVINSSLLTRLLYCVTSPLMSHFSYALNLYCSKPLTPSNYKVITFDGDLSIGIGATPYDLFARLGSNRIKTSLYAVYHGHNVALYVAYGSTCGRVISSHSRGSTSLFNVFLQLRQLLNLSDNTDLPPTPANTQSKLLLSRISRSRIIYYNKLEGRMHI